MASFYNIKRLDKKDCSHCSKMFPSKPTGTVPDHLIFCPLCQMDYSGIQDISDKYTYTMVPDRPWAISIKCPNPMHKKWIVCCTCTNQKSCLDNHQPYPPPPLYTYLRYKDDYK